MISLKMSMTSCQKEVRLQMAMQVGRWNFRSEFDQDLQPHHRQRETTTRQQVMLYIALGAAIVSRAVAGRRRTILGKLVKAKAYRY